MKDGLKNDLKKCQEGVTAHKVTRKMSEYKSIFEGRRIPSYKHYCQLDLNAIIFGKYKHRTTQFNVPGYH